MVLIPGGSNNGSNPLGAGEDWDYSSYPLGHSLTVSSFYMDQYEVTKALWDEVYMWATNNSYGFDNVGAGKATNHPVQMVSWEDCVKWCNARSQKEGRTPVYYTDADFTQLYKDGYGSTHVKGSANGYRLPTGEQWEYAARGDVSSRRFPWGGNTISHSNANYQATGSLDYDLSSGSGYHGTYETGGFPYTSPVGAFESGKNAYGLYDMAGNVWEWCHDYDWWVDQGLYQMCRGGGWIDAWDGDGASHCRVGFYRRLFPYNYESGVGFRTCLPLGPGVTTAATSKPPSTSSTSTTTTTPATTTTTAMPTTTTTTTTAAATTTTAAATTTTTVVGTTTTTTTLALPTPG